MEIYKPSIKKLIDELENKLQLLQESSDESQIIYKLIYCEINNKPTCYWNEIKTDSKGNTTTTKLNKLPFIQNYTIKLPEVNLEKFRDFL